MARLFLIFIFLLSVPVGVFASGVNGDAQISGYYDGSPIVVKTFDRLAGAIGSLTWKGKEFLESADHGRELQSAWSINNQGECNNPTEAGSSDDYLDNTSSSVLQNMSATVNSLNSVVHPAFWLKPGQRSANCPQDLTGANTVITSEDLYSKTVTIGWQDLPNVIEVVGKVTLANSAKFYQAEMPTGYHLTEFSKFYNYDPVSKTLVDITNRIEVTPWDPNAASFIGYLPIVIATSDSNYALGVYPPNISGENLGSMFLDAYTFGIAYTQPPYSGPPTKWSVRFVRGPVQSGDYYYRVYLAIGSLGQVTNTLDQIFQRQPRPFEPQAVGGFDIANCQHIVGWTGLATRANEAMRVSIYQGDNLVFSNLALKKREAAVCQMLGGDNCGVCPSDQPQCQHGFVFLTPPSIKDGVQRDLYAYGLTKLGNSGVISGSPLKFVCSTSLPGDVNMDSKVDIADLRLFTPSLTDVADYNLIVRGFGQ